MAVWSRLSSDTICGPESGPEALKTKIGPYTYHLHNQYLTRHNPSGLGFGSGWAGMRGESIGVHRQIVVRLLAERFESCYINLSPRTVRGVRNRHRKTWIDGFVLQCPC